MKLVRLLKSQPPVMAGEVAGYHDDHADRLVELGYAVHIVDEPVVAAEPAEVETTVMVAPPVNTAMDAPRRPGRPRKV